ncbi:lytic transglycosylase domain-containing protein [Paenactinomyces guangxiensis]|uniref:Lytic transglycosylase domain-containing protein n=1 Tax=Paenactinomyces guangxiensis TaxID=1490290 RepID=A0A7W1WUU4_9BACL|nr:lytic transglycosylase domain-containing protein [Paenactinomyces guangxiensis]MBA4496461.1 lytic transglycosylase domain-containing protein [Paenactinomyces guangxiensis]MBH8593577.1 lytic transglycosylase domain-containing protein [Paenactinomyces guangxiensis]
MELSNIKKWIKPAIVALPPKRTLLIAFVLLLLYLLVASPLFNRLMYPLEYEEYIVNSAEATGADPYLVMAIIRVETKFDPDKQSRVGARGLMQLMPETVDFAIKKGNFSPSFRDYVEDPAINIHMGSWYIAALTKEFKGNKVAVMAAYNAGPGRVHKWLDQGVWDGTRQNVDQIPYGETRHYIQRVTNYYEKYKQLYQHLPKNKQ